MNLSDRSVPPGPAVLPGAATAEPGSDAHLAAPLATHLAAPFAAPLAALLAQVQVGRTHPATQWDRSGWTAIEALARRAQALQGPARTWASQRLATWLAQWQARHGPADAGDRPAPACSPVISPSSSPSSSPVRSPLGSLLALLAPEAGLAPDSSRPGASAPADDGPPTQGDGDGGASSSSSFSAGAAASACPGAEPHPEPGAPRAAAHGLAELKTLRQFRGSWQRLRADQRLRSALASVPGQAGPLNSQHLVLRTLTQLQALSPSALEHCLGYLDALAWLDDATGAGLPAGAHAGAPAGAHARAPGSARPGQSPARSPAPAPRRRGSAAR